MNWFQMVIVLLFLNGLMMIPLSVNMAKMDSYPVEETYPNAFAMLDESVVEFLDGAEFSEGTLSLSEPFIEEYDAGIVGGNVSTAQKEQALEAPNTLLFQENELIIKDGENPVTSVTYTKDFSIEEVSSVEELKSELSRQWFIQNKSFIVGSLLVSLFILLLVSIVLITLGSSLFVYLSKKGQLSTIRTYKESVNLVVNTLGLPTIIAMILGFIQFDIITMIMTQTFGFVILLLVVFTKTRFSDDVVNQMNTNKK
ncbi:hypothetical protein [Robertmurraya yapensis (ex Hitch et al 2024)]|uniref:hypothetical protein n=1 Tax=Robertmurraya yapensis (ex Hitch et al 2024) TaxID=3133160 RepID=UPI003EBE0A3E